MKGSEKIAKTTFYHFQADNMEKLLEIKEDSANQFLGRRSSLKRSASEPTDVKEECCFEGCADEEMLEYCAD